MANKPVKTYKAGKVQVNVWVNKAQGDRQFDSVSYQVSKNYKVGDDWKTTNNFSLNELADLATLITQIQQDYRVKVFTNETVGSGGANQGDIPF